MRRLEGIVEFKPYHVHKQTNKTYRVKIERIIRPNQWNNSFEITILPSFFDGIIKYFDSLFLSAFDITSLMP